MKPFARAIDNSEIILAEKNLRQTVVLFFKRIAGVILKKPIVHRSATQTIDLKNMYHPVKNCEVLLAWRDRKNKFYHEERIVNLVTLAEIKACISSIVFRLHDD